MISRSDWECENGKISSWLSHKVFAGNVVAIFPAVREENNEVCIIFKSKFIYVAHSERPQLTNSYKYELQKHKNIQIK